MVLVSLMPAQRSVYVLYNFVVTRPGVFDHLLRTLVNALLPQWEISSSEVVAYVMGYNQRQFLLSSFRIEL
jgi:hypothetical protein